jgi:molecular chaperone GrpE
VNEHDRSEHAENGEGERVVVRDRRRIDPVTGDVRAPAGEQSPAGAAPPAEEDVPVSETDLDPRVEELTAEVAERTADLQRVSAEYANYRRRVDRDRESVLVGARVQFVSELLTTLDDIDRAESHGDLTGPFKSVADKIVAVAQKQGLEPFAADGDLFDPSLHEAVQHESGDIAGPTVAVVSSVLRRGYRIADRVLRPAMVTVVDQPADGPEPSENPEQ